MLSLVTHWARIDDTQLGRPKLSGQEELNPLAVPMMVLYVIDEVCRDEERLQNIYSEDEEWAVQQILKHLQVLMSRSPWFCSKKGVGQATPLDPPMIVYKSNVCFVQKTIAVRMLELW